MRAEGSAPIPASSARRLPLFCGIGALVTAGLLLLLPGSVNASDGKPAGPSSNSAESVRPAWLRPLGEETHPPEPSEQEPSFELRSGWSKLEPGVLDVQAWDWLQQDLVRMLDQTPANAAERLSPEAFEAKFLGATVEFLEIDAEEAEIFQTAVDQALGEIEGAREEMLRRKPELEPGLDEAVAMNASQAGWEEYARAQRDAVRHPLAVLQERPRHQLLREDMLKWLLRLAYGMGAAAE